MLKKNYLFKNFVYVSTAHTRPILKKYFNNLDKSIKEIIDENKGNLEKIKIKPSEQIIFNEVNAWYE